MVPVSVHDLYSRGFSTSVHIHSVLNSDDGYHEKRTTLQPIHLNQTNVLMTNLYAVIFNSVIELASPRVSKISTTMSHPSLIGLFTCCK